MIPDSKVCRAIICPHAGYIYCGPTLKQSYSSLRDAFDTDFILLFGPSHFKRLHNSCALSPFQYLDTPLGRLSVAVDAVAALSKHPDLFAVLSQEEDETEHSLEMQYPFIKYFLETSKSVPILPILVGQFDTMAQRSLAAKKLLQTLSGVSYQRISIVISSDFCHYGPRFGFNPNLANHLHHKIKEMDYEGFEALADKDDPVNRFSNYLHETQNTICGREAILLGLETLKLLNISGQWKLLGYSQSNQAQSPKDSSVSYLSAGLFVDTS